MADFLVCHELNEEPVFGCQTGGLEVFDGEFGKTVVEEVEFDPFLVKSKSLVLSETEFISVKLGGHIPMTRSQSRSSHCTLALFRSCPIHQLECMEQARDCAASHHLGRW